MDGTPTHGDLLCSLLADTDAPCPGCGYNLRGLRTRECPECGDPLAIRLSRRAPKHAAIALGGVPLAAGAVNAILWSSAVFLYGMEDSQRPSIRHGVFFAAVSMLYGVPGLVLWQRSRKLLHGPLRRLRKIAVASWAGSIMLAVAALWIAKHA